MARAPSRMGRRPTVWALSVDLSPLWIIADDSHTVATHRVRRFGHIRRVSLALTQAAWLAACSGTLPGVPAAEPPRRPPPVPPRAVQAAPAPPSGYTNRSEEHTSELQSPCNL